MIGLKPIRQNAQQQMARKVRWCSPPEHCVPSGSKFLDIETPQSRDLDLNVELLPIQRRRWTNRHARHDA